MEPGTVIADRFVVERLAGSGGMGSVYRTTDRTTGEPVALKIVHKKGASDIGRFLREGKALAELRHPAIVRYVAHGVTGGGHPYLAMEWLEGEDLTSRLEKRGLTLDESLDLARRVAQALAVAHARGLVHRDVKPSNVFLPEGELPLAKVIDFGVVRLTGGRDRTALTLPGTMLGTPGFMAPEQVRGTSEVDARADVFSLGCLLYGCLTGREAFAANDPIAVLTRVLFEEPLPPSLVFEGIPPSVDSLVIRMLSKDPAARPADGAAVDDAIGALKLTSAGRRAAPNLRHKALTGGEQRVVSIALAAPSTPMALDETTATPAPSDPTPPDLKKKIEALGARFEPLANGALVVISQGAGTAADHAVQAARCALAMREVMPGVPIAVATGRSDASSATPVGEVIDRAVALLRGHEGEPSVPAATVSDVSLPDVFSLSQSYPLSGLRRPIKVDSVTAGLLDSRFEIVSLGMGDLELRREKDTFESARLLLGKETPCVGRDREISMLLGVFEECVSEPVARAVLVTAQAGIGKSRLRHELTQRLKARPGELQIWIGRGDPMSAGSPFGMLSHAIRAALRLRDDDPIEARRDKLRERVARRLPKTSAPRVTEFLGELIGVPFPEENSVPLRAARQDPVLHGDQMRRAWEDFVLAEATRRPTLLILEDLHWGDVPTVRMVDAALRHAAEAPFMVLGLARPLVHDLFPGLWAERGMQEVRLGELTKKASEKLVRAVLGEDAAPESVQRVVTQAAGNAFYLEELIRAIADGRRKSLPETVIAMVQARLAAIDPEGRRVLRAASVFGQTFWKGGVRALLGEEAKAAQVDEWLRHLEERELVVRRPASRFRGDDELSFRHGLVCEAAYAMLTNKDLRLGHKLAGQWLAHAGETDPVALAEHYERADERESASGLYLQAAEQALEGGDLTAALTRVERGLACGAEGETLGAFRLVEAEAHRWAAEFARSEQASHEALAVLAPGTSRRFAAIAEAVVASSKLGHNERMAEVASELGAALPATSADTTAFAIAAARASGELMFAGRYDRAQAILARLETLAEASGGNTAAFAGWLADGRSTGAMMAGDTVLCLGYMDEAARAFERAGDLRNACTERGYVGFAYLELGLYALAEAALLEALAVAERAGLHTVASTARHNLGLALAHQGRLDEARQMEERALAEFRAQGDGRLEGGALNYLAQILALVGDLEAAEQMSLAAMSSCHARPARLAGAYGTHSIVLRQRGYLADALAAATEGMRILEQLGAIEEGESRLRLAYVDALLASGKDAEAAVALHAARARVMAQADKISDPDVRRSFLENVSEHARIRALVAEAATTR